MTAVRSTRISPPDIADAVLGVTGRERGPRRSVALLAAFLTHATVTVGMLQVKHGVPAAAAAPPSSDLEIDLAAPPPPPRLAPADVARSPTGAVHTGRSAAPRAAQAADVVARAVESRAPVDLTADAVVMGNATAYAGGATSADGTSRTPVTEPAAAPKPGLPTATATLNPSSPVSLASENWTCPWPREADAEQIDEQTVILRVVVSAGGDAQSATLLADPGHGFGPAAVACAMRTRFTPALDARGRPIRAASPPIRVRFTR